VVRDIYSHSAALDVTLVVEAALTTANIENCYTEVISMQGMAFDVYYVPGTFKRVKLHY
jgi:hypothetical protein